MKSEFYTTVKNILLTVKIINAVKIWNESILDKLDSLGEFPLVFMQFSNISYETTIGNLQECNRCTIVVHILYKTLDSQDPGVFDVSQGVYYAMQKSGFKRIQENPLYTGTEIIDWQITFEAPRWTDDATKEVMTKYLKPPLQINI